MDMVRRALEEDPEDAAGSHCPRSVAPSRPGRRARAVLPARAGVRPTGTATCRASIEVSDRIGKPVGVRRSPTRPGCDDAVLRQLVRPPGVLRRAVQLQRPHHQAVGAVSFGRRGCRLQRSQPADASGQHAVHAKSTGQRQEGGREPQTPWLHRGQERLRGRNGAHQRRDGADRRGRQRAGAGQGGDSDGESAPG